MSECFKCGSGNETLISDKLVPELHCFSCYNKEIDSLNTSTTKINSQHPKVNCLSGGGGNNESP